MNHGRNVPIQNRMLLTKKPMCVQIEGPDRVTARLYSEVLDMEVTAVGMEIPWAGGEDAYLMACEKVKTQKKK